MTRVKIFVTALRHYILAIAEQDSLIADILERLMIRAVEAGEVGADGFDDQFVALMDSSMLESAPGAELVLAILKERGWSGWTRIERVPANRLNTQT